MKLKYKSWSEGFKFSKKKKWINFTVDSLLSWFPYTFPPGGGFTKEVFLLPLPPPLSLSPTLLNLLLDRQKSRKMGFYFLEKSRKMAGFYCWEKSRKMGFYCVEKSRKMGFYCLEQFRLRPPHSSSSLPV